MNASAVPPIAVVGASLAGLSAVQTFVEFDSVTSVTVFGADPHLPYDRPPLSKEVLRGVWEPERTALDLVEDPRVSWRVGTPVSGLEGVGSADGPALLLAGGERIGFPGGVLIATGTTPRLVPGSDLAGVHVLRTRDDAVALKADLDSGARRVVVAGGGFIGSEVAAACVEAGAEVTVLEAQEAPFGRVLGAEVGEAVMAGHRRRGVRVRTAASVASLRGEGHVSAVELADGEQVGADLVVLGLGVVPCTSWLAGSGLNTNDGVECDASLSAGARVVAAGDVARWPNPRFGELRRVEHWENAIRQGRHAARRLLADHAHEPVEDFNAVPWVWSDQYDDKLQVVGSTFSFDEVAVVHGSLGEGRFLALYRRGEELVAAVGLNSSKLVSRYRRLLARPVTWAEGVAAVPASAPPT